ncbi:MAG: NAD(P)-binding domain-containing protein [Deltaproteobacteria bacterium]|nr:NAD(P)-binding domain-containing protein [Deltaproteobacteria bacterium]
MASLLAQLFSAKRPEPSYPVLPAVDDRQQTSVAGIYAVGELAGTPLVKLGLNAGHQIVEQLADELGRSDRDAGLLDLVIVGSGSSGFAAALAAKDRGLRALTLEASKRFNTFETMTKGKWLFAEPADVPLRSRVWFEECTREQLLEKWSGLADAEGLDIRQHEPVIDIRGKKGAFVVVTAVGEYRCKRVVLCMGKAGNPRKLGVPGEREHADKVFHRLIDPDDFRGQHLLIVGAGDVACEAAIALAAERTNRVTLSAVDQELSYPKKRNIDAVRELERQGRLRILLDSRVKRIAAGHVEVELADRSVERIDNNSVFEMIGAELPLGFLKKVGVRLNDQWSVGRWLALAAVFVLVYSFYSLKSYGKGAVAWPFEGLISPESYDGVLRSVFKACFAPFAPLFSPAARADLAVDRGFQQGFLYSLLYSVVMLVFGYLALIRWRNKAKDKRYQTYRYLSLLTFQLVFFFVVNVIGVQALSVKYAWRAWGLYQPFPLFFNTFFWWSPGDPRALVWFFVCAGLVGTFVAIPLLARYHGKRFCTWVCGCGGLAETLGDRWRHLSAKGPRSRAWEFQAVVVLVAAFFVGMIVVGWYRTSGSNGWWNSYNYLVDFWLVAVIPIALYPFFGGKVWCRYWCPLAAYNQLLSRWFGKLKIVSNDKCITCTECSKYCQVGVDVMAFAKNQQPFDNSNSACIHCGICIDVCPMAVLSFESSSTSAKQLIAQGKSSAVG